MATTNITPYTEKELAVLVEEYITQQPKEFTLKGLTSLSFTGEWKTNAS